jgi:hypothetical protein
MSATKFCVVAIVAGGAKAVTSTKRLDARLVFGLPIIPAMEKERQRAIGPMSIWNLR